MQSDWAGGGRSGPGLVERLRLQPLLHASVMHNARCSRGGYAKEWRWLQDAANQKMKNCRNRISEPAVSLHGFVSPLRPPPFWWRMKWGSGCGGVCLLYSQLFSRDFLFAPFPFLPSSPLPLTQPWVFAPQTRAQARQAERRGTTISATGECECLGPTEWQRRLCLNINGL